MNVLILTGSPHIDGTTAQLAAKFEEGAREANHTVTKLNTAALDLHPCRACKYCRSHEGQCVQKDGMEQIYPALLAADAIVFVSPLYYFGFSAQIKMAIDRFYCVHSKLRGKKIKSVLLSAGSDKDDWAMYGLVANYKTMLRHMEWECHGFVTAMGYSNKESIQNTVHLEDAYHLGKTL